MTGKRIFICGGAGFVGQNLVPRLAEKHRVTVVDKDGPGLESLTRRNRGVESLHVDLALDRIDDARLGNVDVVIQLNAQIASPDREAFVLNNVTAAENLIETCRKSRVGYFIHVSSAAAQSVRSDPYSDTKKRAEQLVRTSQLRYSILRPSMMYGPFDDKNVAWLIGFLEKFPVVPLPGSGRYPRQPVYVQDFCEIVSQVVQNEPEGGEFDIHGDPIAFVDMVRAILKSQGLRRPILRIPVPLFKLLLRTYNRVRGRVAFTPEQIESLVSGELFETRGGWEAFSVRRTSFEEGLANMFAARPGE